MVLKSHGVPNAPKIFSVQVLLLTQCLFWLNAQPSCELPNRRLSISHGQELSHRERLKVWSSSRSLYLYENLIWIQNFDWMNLWIAWSWKIEAVGIGPIKPLYVGIGPIKPLDIGIGPIKSLAVGIGLFECLNFYSTNRLLYTCRDHITSGACSSSYLEDYWPYAGGLSVIDIPRMHLCDSITRNRPNGALWYRCRGIWEGGVGQNITAQPYPGILIFMCLVADTPINPP